MTASALAPIMKHVVDSLVSCVRVGNMFDPASGESRVMEHVVDV